MILGPYHKQLRKIYQPLRRRTSTSRTGKLRTLGLFNLKNASLGERPCSSFFDSIHARALKHSCRPNDSKNGTEYFRSASPRMRRRTKSDYRNIHTGTCILNLRRIGLFLTGTPTMILGRIDFEVFVFWLCFFSWNYG